MLRASVRRTAAYQRVQTFPSVRAPRSCGNQHGAKDEMVMGRPVPFATAERLQFRSQSASRLSRSSVLS